MFRFGAVLSAGSIVVALATSVGAQDRSYIQSTHSHRIEALKQLSGIHDQFNYAIHTLIVPVGALPNYKFPIPVARLRYEAVPFFNFDEAQPRPEAKLAIEDLARRFKEDTALARVAVVGHTDSVGPEKYNYDLSLRRAASVANFLRVNGVPSEKITVVGLGAAYPLATNETPGGRSFNRRVEFFLSSVPEAIPSSIQGPGFDPKLRQNKQDCKDGDANCGKGSMNTFPAHVLTTTGQLRPTGELIVIDPTPTHPVQEIPEREHIPMQGKIRPHI